MDPEWPLESAVLARMLRLRALKNSYQQIATMLNDEGMKQQGRGNLSPGGSPEGSDARGRVKLGVVSTRDIVPTKTLHRA